MSRILYQTYASEKKSRPESARRFKRIFWEIASGDGSYKEIAWSMLQPRTLWMIFWGGVLVTLRNRAAELFFGLDWHGISRVPTAVSLSDMKINRERLLPQANRHLPEFECMYTIRIRAPARKVLELLAKFGEPDRPYLNPHWLTIHRSSGEPLQPGCVIEYSVFAGMLSFSIEQRPGSTEEVIAYKVRDGFAHNGDFIFEILPKSGGYCDLTVYLAFDYPRGGTLSSSVYWWLFRSAFPNFVHDVLWNHTLCKFKSLAEVVTFMDPDVLSESESRHIS